MNESGPIDHYGALGVDPSATAEEIRAAYRRLAWTHHPDRNIAGTESAKERSEAWIRRVNEAYEVLSDPIKRAAYDVASVASVFSVGRAVVLILGGQVVITSDAHMSGAASVAGIEVECDDGDFELLSIEQKPISAASPSDVRLRLTAWWRGEARTVALYYSLGTLEVRQNVALPRARDPRATPPLHLTPAGRALPAWRRWPTWALAGIVILGVFFVVGVLSAIFDDGDAESEATPVAGRTFTVPTFAGVPTSRVPTSSVSDLIRTITLGGTPVVPRSTDPE